MERKKSLQEHLASEGQEAVQCACRQRKRGVAMDQGPLVREQIDAGARFLAEFQKYAPIRVAFWLKDADTGRWSLYIASDQINDDNLDAADDEVIRIVRMIHDPWIGLLQIKLISDSEELAKAALKTRRRYPDTSAARLYGETIDWINIEDMYIYPTALPAPAH